MSQFHELPSPPPGTPWGICFFNEFLMELTHVLSLEESTLFIYYAKNKQFGVSLTFKRLSNSSLLNPSTNCLF